jgi:enoyl-CoA hydratase/carnithine racemase
MEKIISTQAFETSIQESVAIIRIKKNVFELISDRNQSAKLFDFLNSLNNSNRIKALFYYNDEESFCEEEYDYFIKRLLGDSPSGARSVPPCFSQKNVRSREINILNELIRTITGLHILVVSGVQGVVVTPYIGTAMAADIRYACNDAQFAMAHLKHGLHPSGGVPFFLSEILSHSNTVELLLRKENISAHEALELELVSKLFSKSNFEESAITEINHTLSNITHCSIQQTKRLINFRRKTISSYFEYEMRLLNL